MIALPSCEEAPASDAGDSVGKRVAMYTPRSSAFKIGSGSWVRPMDFLSVFS